MKNDKKILIKNIFIMLSYAYNKLLFGDFKRIATEEFDSIDDLFAEILLLSFSKQLKRGLYKTYLQKEESLYLLRGKLNISMTIQNRIRNDLKLSNEYDEFSVDNLFNRIIKASFILLSKDKRVSKDYKKRIRNFLYRLGDITNINPKEIDWDSIVINRNNKSYEFILNICYFILEDVFPNTDDGDLSMQLFLDKNMPKLYEKFVLNFYKDVRIEDKEHKYGIKNVSANKIKWNSDGHIFANLGSNMNTDITIVFENNKILIIDAKYYTTILKERYDKKEFNINNFYQIHTYVTEKDSNHTGLVSGLLLYAKVKDDIELDDNMKTLENKYFVKTLDLNKDFIGEDGLRYNLIKILTDCV